LFSCREQILQAGQQLQQAALDNASKGGSSIFKQQPRSNATLQDGARAAAAMAAAMSSCRVSREATNDGSAASHSHAFWETQPVMQFSEAGDQKVILPLVTPKCRPAGLPLIRRIVQCSVFLTREVPHGVVNPLTSLHLCRAAACLLWMIDWNHDRNHDLITT
jgi:hypothetical protein